MDSSRMKTCHMKHCVGVQWTYRCHLAIIITEYSLPNLTYTLIFYPQFQLPISIRWFNLSIDSSTSASTHTHTQLLVDWQWVRRCSDIIIFTHVQTVIMYLDSAEKGLI